MYELNNKIRLIDVPSYKIMNSEQFVGFISGIISQDHDLEQMYFDSFLKIACLEENNDVEPIIKELEVLSEAFKVTFVLSVSLDEDELPASVKDKIIVSL